MIRILHAIEGLEIGGAENLIINLHKNIDRSKIQFDYIITNPSENQAYKYEVRKLGGIIYTLPAFNGLNLFKVIRAWRRFFHFHSEYKILHSHIRSYASIFIPIAKHYKLKTIIHSHSISNGTGFKAIVKNILQYPLRIQADYFMACSEESGKWLFGSKIINSKRFDIVKNGIDIEKFIYNIETREKIRHELGLIDEKVFIHVGRFIPAKNHLFIINLFLEIHKCDKKTKLILVGDGDLKEVIERKIKENNLQKSVILIGSKKNVNDYLQAADCMLFPSLWEGLGIAVVEAQASGLTCLCSNNVPQAVKIIDSCEFINLKDKNKWLELSLRKIQLRKDETNAIKNAGYDINTTALQISNFYQKILNLHKDRYNYQNLNHE